MENSRGCLVTAFFRLGKGRQLRGKVPSLGNAISVGPGVNSAYSHSCLGMPGWVPKKAASQNFTLNAVALVRISTIRSGCRVSDAEGMIWAPLQEQS